MQFRPKKTIPLFLQLQGKNEDKIMRWGVRGGVKDRAVNA
jgi:hypothetical protein